MGERTISCLELDRYVADGISLPFPSLLKDLGSCYFLGMTVHATGEAHEYVQSISTISAHNLMFEIMRATQLRILYGRPSRRDEMCEKG